MATAQRLETRTATAPAPAGREAAAGRTDPGVAAFWLLRLGFTAAPILFGIDKFFNWMVEWTDYLWVEVADVLPGTAQQIMYGVGVVEIVAGLTVLVAPRIGGALVAAWLATIVGNLVLQGIFEDGAEYWDVALRDVGLFAGAVALFLLALKYQPARTHS